MNNYKRCSNGHFYIGDACPYCETELFPVKAVRTRTDKLYTTVTPPDREPGGQGLYRRKRVKAAFII